MRLCFSILLFLATFCSRAQTTYEFTAAANRQKHDEELKARIETTLRSRFSPMEEGKWLGSFWAMELTLYRSNAARQRLAEAWRRFFEFSEGFQKALLEVSYTLYPSVFDQQASTILRQTASPAIFVRCAEYLLLSKNRDNVKELLLQQLSRFQPSNYSGIRILKERLQPANNVQSLRLSAAFSQDLLPGQTVIYSLQRSNRNYPGLVLIRKTDGSFLRQRDNSFFAAAQLARAITGYPFYITNGNTPQGLFRWTGFDTSSISYIGPTPNLQLVMPYETKPAVFFGDSAKPLHWTPELYASLLTPALAPVKAVWESFYAGQIGRTEIIMHGTTINPAYYKGQSYFPQTPSLGCLCSYEAWDKTGKRTVSNQQKIVDGLLGIGASQGYVFVIDIDDKKAPVSIDEVRAFLR